MTVMTTIRSEGRMLGDSCVLGTEKGVARQAGEQCHGAKGVMPRMGMEVAVSIRSGAKEGGAVRRDAMLES